MSEFVIHYKDAETLYEHTDFPFLLEEYLREEIVRCRDCKYYIDSDLFYNPFCSFLNDHDTQPDGFCAWGERNA